MSLSSLWRICALLIAVFLPLQAYGAQTCGIAVDEFSTKTYSAQDGNGLLNWTSGWIERGDDGNPSSGDFIIEGGHLAIYGDFCWGCNPNDSIEREIDLSGVTSATLKMVANHVLGASDIELQVSRNGGASWTTLQKFEWANGGYKPYEYDISAYLSSNTRIRFLNSASGGELDWMGIEFISIVACSGVPDSGPPACTDTFKNALSVHDSNGFVSFLNNTQVLNASSRYLEAPWIKHIAYTDSGGVYSCVTQHCGASGVVAPKLSYGSFPVWSTSQNWTQNSPGGNIGQTTNYYNDITVGTLSTATVTNQNYNTFYIKRLKMGSGSKIVLASGDYYIERFSDLVGTEVLNVNIEFIIPDNAKVRLFLREGITLYAGVKFNVSPSGGMGNPGNLLMYFYTTDYVRLTDGATISGYVYTGGLFSIGNNLNPSPRVIGAVSAGEIFLGPGTRVQYDGSGLSSVNFGPACTSPKTDHYRIGHAGSGVTCQSVPVTISAHKADGTSYTKGGQTISLSTSTGNGTWVLLSGSGSLVDSTLDDGAASYTFGAGESAVQLGFKSTHVETLNVNVSDGAASESNSYDPSLTMANAGLTFLINGAVGSVGTQISGKSTNIDIPQGTHARSVNLGLRVISTDPTTGACKSRVPAGNHTVQWGFECNEPATCQMLSPGEVNGAAVVGNNNGSAISYTSLSSSFDGNATTSFNLNYLDAGRVRLHAKMSVAATAKEPAMTLTQSTNAFVVRPFGIGFTGIQSDSGVPNQGALPSNSSTLSNNQFAPAGGAFDFSLGGYRYNPLHDAAAAADRNGYPNASADISANPLTANFTGDATVAVANVLPASGSWGSLGKSDGLRLTAGGVTRYENQSWSEVGTLKIAASVSNYLSTGVNITGVSPYIGRFYPASFVLGASTSVTPRAYMGQPFALAYQLKAVNTAGGVTQNYDDALGYATALVKYSAENDNNGTDIVNRLTFEPGGWKSGLYGTQSGGVITLPYHSNNLVYQKPAVSELSVSNGAATPQNNVQIGLSIAGALSGLQGTANMNASTTGNCSALGNCDAHALGTVNLRFGRLVGLPAQGTEDASKPLEIRFEMQYWDGSRFVRENNDSTTTFYQLAGGGVYSGTPSLQDYKGDLSAGEITVTPPVLSRFNNGITPVGEGFTFTNVPGLGNRGAVNVRFTTSDIADWAEFDRDGDGGNDDPDDDLIVPISFAPKRGHDNIILWKENP